MGVELDSKQNNLVAEYAAGVLIKYSYNHSNRYKFSDEELDEEDATEPDEPTSEDETTEPPTTSENETSTSENETTDADDNNKETEQPEELQLEQVLGLENVSVKCDGYEVIEEMDADPEGYFVLTAESGYKFVVLNFILTNMSDEAVTVNTVDRNIILKAAFNEKYKYNNYDASILRNDLTMLKNVTIDAGSDYKAVAIFMIPEDVADSIESFVVMIASDDHDSGVYIIE